MRSEPTVLVIDPDPAARQATLAVVKSMQLQTQLYPSAEALLDGFDPWQPGCLVSDVELPGLSGLDLLERLEGCEPQLPVILLAAHASIPLAVRMMKAGAWNFLDKSCAAEQLREAIRDAITHDALRRRQTTFSARIGQRLAQLTSGEYQVLEMLLAGHSNKEIAAGLGLSMRTIEVRRAKLMQKMHAASLAELVRLALSAKMLAGSGR